MHEDAKLARRRELQKPGDVQADSDVDGLLHGLVACALHRDEQALTAVDLAKGKDDCRAVRHALNRRLKVGFRKKVRVGPQVPNFQAGDEQGVHQVSGAAPAHGTPRRRQCVRVAHDVDRRQARDRGTGCLKQLRDVAIVGVVDANGAEVQILDIAAHALDELNERRQRRERPHAEERLYRRIENGEQLELVWRQLQSRAARRRVHVAPRTRWHIRQRQALLRVIDRVAAHARARGGAATAAIVLVA
mmetsp:Transcript_43185/g.119448  ORF Transcript_43185/g.119448 Transcript_43185/m.119448 type:complete len:247 (-) Transcript_43185:1003-1743(-)